MTAARGAFAASLGREWARLRADPWDAAMLTWIPALLYLLTWWTFSAGVARELPLVVYDRDHSALSRSLARALDQSPGLQVAAQVPDEASAWRMIRARQAYGVLVIPRDLGQHLQAGASDAVQWAYNGQFASHTGAMTRDVRTVVGTLSAGVELQARERRGAGATQAGTLYEPVAIRAGAFVNDTGSYLGALALPVSFALLHILATVAAVVGIGRELRAATVPNWLEAAHGRLAIALAAKLAWPLAAFTLHCAVLGVLYGALGWPVAGSSLAVVLGTGLFLTACLALGTVLAAFTSSLRSALSACAFVTAPAFAFAGQGFPIAAMPLGARAWAAALPLTHYLDLLNNAWLGGAPWRFAAPAVGTLLLFTVVLGAAGAWRLGRRVRQPDSWGKA